MTTTVVDFTKTKFTDENCKNGTIVNIFAKGFFENVGFGKYLPHAIELLKNLFKILDEYQIDYFLISGTLLGHVRHNGNFIPWDDDIDIIVDKKIFDVKDAICEKYKEFEIFKHYNSLLKFYGKNIGIGIENKSYKWPFIDLFISDQNNDNLFFFKKEWDIKHFYPKTLVTFVGIENVSIPSNPDYFLKKNYGENYMTEYLSSYWNHRSEHAVKYSAKINVQDYEKFKQIHYSK